MNHVKTQGWSNRFDRDTVFFGRVMAPDRLGFQTWACSLWTSWFSASSSTFWACLETWGPVQDRTSRVSGSPWGLWEEGVTSGKASRHSAPRCLRDILCFFLVIRTMASHYLRVIYIYMFFFHLQIGSTFIIQGYYLKQILAKVEPQSLGFHPTQQKWPNPISGWILHGIGIINKMHPAYRVGTWLHILLRDSPSQFPRRPRRRWWLHTST